MAQRPLVIESGLKIVDVGTMTGVEHIQGSGAPSMDAPVGSLYSDRSSGSHYQKVTAGAGSGNWKKLATTEDVSAVIGTWRPERVLAVTGAAIDAGTTNVNIGLLDQDGSAPAAVDYAVGDFIISYANTAGSVKLLEITANDGLGNVTFADAALPLLQDDTFVCRHYLPDPAGQENQAIVNYNGSVIVKIADADWGRADALALAPMYVAVNGSVSSGDSVNSAIEKLDGNQQDLIALTGVVQGETDLGAFTGTTIADDQTIKAALQDLETAHEGLADDVGNLVSLSGVAVDSTQFPAASSVADFGWGAKDSLLYSAYTTKSGFENIVYMLSQMTSHVKTFNNGVASGWQNIFLHETDGYGMVKAHVMVVPAGSRAIRSYEIMMVADGGVGGSADYSIYAKLAPATRGGVALPAVGVLDPECQFRCIIDGSGKLSFDIEIPNTTATGATISYEVFFQIFPVSVSSYFSNI